ncbi:MAG: large conductance mechanosensitive channel protein MscL [Lachnospiraceae bacterium]|nr:large conductance mechanosensitive channel protein MscL [Lachnospiraceae bacterium]
MGFIKEFKAFVMRGNVVDMAVGVIIGGAFTGIVNSLVNDVIMPVISLATGKIDFTNLFIALDGGSYPTLAAAQEAGASVFAYGSFIQAIISFLLIALVLFSVIKTMNKLSKPAAPAPVTTKICPFCKSEVNKEATKCAFCASELKD